MAWETWPPLLPRMPRQPRNQQPRLPTTISSPTPITLPSSQKGSLATQPSWSPTGGLLVFASPPQKLHELRLSISHRIITQYSFFNLLSPDLWLLRKSAAIALVAPK